MISEKLQINSFKNSCRVIGVVALCFMLVFTSCSKFTYEKKDDGIEFQVNGQTKRVLFYNDNLVRVSLVKAGVSFKDSSLVLIKKETFSDFNIKEDRQKLVLNTPALSLSINKTNGVITFRNSDKQIYLSESETYLPQIADTLIDQSTYYHIKQSFQISDDEALYGLGQFQNGYMNYRNKDLLLIQANKTALVPVLVSTKKYGILWDNYSASNFHDGEDGMSFRSEVADQIDYFFIGAKTMDGVVAGYRTLTGKAPLFAKKAYGFWQSKERYTSFDELSDVVARYRENKLPIDNIVQDWRYWGDNHYWSSMYFKGKEYSNPEKNIEKLHNQHVDFMVSIWPVLGDSSKIFKEMAAKGLLYNQDHWCGGKVYDAYSEAGRGIYWKHIQNGLAEKGVDAYWMDGTEPEFSDTNDPRNTERELLKVGKTVAGPIAKYLNTYALVTTDGVYSQHREYTDEKRVFILTRSSWAGQQRNAAVTWSGDISASYDTFKKQISAGLNFCITGVPYWTHDIGSFFPTSAGGMYPGGINDPAYQELYVRWFQFGAFTPIFRSHGTGTPREVWQFKDRNPEFYNALRKSLNLRYQLYPYVYSNAWQITANDYTLMRALVMDFPDDKDVYNVPDQYMFGESFLVKPVTIPMYYDLPQMPKSVPAENLFTADGKQGLKVSYFKGENLEKLIYEGVDKEINHNWGGGGLPPGVPENHFSVRWEGFLKPIVTGEYTLTFSSDDGCRVWLNNELVINDWSIHATTTFKYKVNLKAGEKYPIKIDYFQGENDAIARLGWQTPTSEKTDDERSKTVSVYLPESNGWYDFWTNKFYSGKQTISGEYPIDIFPLFVKAGSIVPMTTVQQYADEDPNAPFEIRIYSGNDASFTYYEDEGNNYNYETGEYNTISFDWKEHERRLMIGASEGNFHGFKKAKKLKVVLIDPEASIQVIKEYDYTGDAAVVVF
ncbi:glycoside hydrolase family 31 protein [Draconibacterium mangrovi]|uniref:glycoside hydrolase family 31 protein n=1 Tax=Draconibacterium mangrovi TaxID=2697469 RepID=UPI0013D1411E|nr:TIM-barrel domain-containing protein [Draconibacterium mangrovi]